jgi:hypothetical protein
MYAFWNSNPFLLVVLAGICVPLFGILFGAWSTWLHFQHRREALDTLKIYAQQGKTPPPEVLEALGGGFGGAAPGPGFAPGPGAPPPWAEDLVGGIGSPSADRYARRAERYAWRVARWRAREPYRRWNGAVTLAALTAGFGFASQHANGNGANAFMLVAIILGACAVGAVITALLSTFLRP